MPAAPGRSRHILDNRRSYPPFRSRRIPNLVVADIDRSLAFYRDVVGFIVDMKVPGEPSFVFASVKRDEVEVFTHITGIAEYDEAVRVKTPILMPLEKKWYEYNLTFAQQD